MRLHKHKGFLPVQVFVAVLVLLTLAGCVEVRVADSTPAAKSLGTAGGSSLSTSQEHNLAIMGVDFDPSLDYEHLVRLRQPVTLLVAVENMGRKTERQVVVRAQLSAAEDPRFVLKQEATIADIAPGEVQVVRFPRLEKVPSYPTYHLEVQVDPLPAEANFGDNRRAFDIQIRPEQQNP